MCWGFCRRILGLVRLLPRELWARGGLLKVKFAYACCVILVLTSFFSKNCSKRLSALQGI